MNRQLLDELLSRKAKLVYKDWEAYFAGYNESGLIKARLDLRPGNTLPRLYDRGTWTVICDENSYEFLGEIKERYSQDNACVVDIHMLNGLYKKQKEKILSFDKDREAIIITSSSEKMVVNILKLNPNHAIVQSSMEIPENSKVWLRYKELAIACLPGLEHNGENEQFIYDLDFSVETLEKRGRIAEMILKDKL